MAKCDEGYRCAVCGEPVERLRESELYLKFVIGWIDPETLHITPDRHIECNPALAQFIRHAEFEPVECGGAFDKSNLDAAFAAERETLVTRGWARLLELEPLDLPIHEYPLEEVRAKWREAGNDPEKPIDADLRKEP